MGVPQGSLDEAKAPPLHASMLSEREVHLSGLTSGDRELLVQALLGLCWVTAQNGRLQFVPAVETPPREMDPGMSPFWREYDEKRFGIQLKLFEFEQLPNGASPSILIQSLCGYDYTPEGYVACAEKLTAYGFVCMRSRRGADGRFWEAWYLPGLWAAKGRLEEEIKAGLPKRAEQGEWNQLERRKLKKALDFLGSRRSEVSFGTLDVANQRMAMVMDN